MNGDDVQTIKTDVALIRKDIARLGEILGEVRTDIKAQKECHQSNEERIADLEKIHIEMGSWRNHHDRDHSRISNRLGQLKPLDQKLGDLGVEIVELKTDLKHYSRISGGLVGGGVAGLIALGKEVIGMLTK